MGRAIAAIASSFQHHLLDTQPEHSSINPLSQEDINVIVGGPTDRDSNRTSKAHSNFDTLAVNGPSVPCLGPQLTFNHDDLERVVFPRNDALVIWIVIANYEVTHVLIYSGSSNVLFKRAFD